VTDDHGTGDQPGPAADRTELDGVVRSIGDHARTVNLTRAAGLSAALDRAETGQLPNAGRSAAAELAHQLLGSAGTFGFSGVSDLAAELERFFREAEFDEAGLISARERMSELLKQLASEPDY